MSLMGILLVVAILVSMHYLEKHHSPLSLYLVTLVVALFLASLV